MRVIHDVDELMSLVGKDLGAGEWCLVDQRRIDTFAEATGDHQWIHVDPSRAAEGPFGGTIGHGLLTLSLVPLLCASVYRFEGANLVLNYGYDRVRFTSVVPVGSRLRAHLRCAGVEQVPTGVRARFVATVELEGAPKPAAVVELVLIFLT